MKRALIVAALCTGLAAGPAIAQTTGSVSKNSGGPDTMSTQERDMYKENTDWLGFFTDDSYTELKSDEDNAMTYSELSEDRKDAIRRDCERTRNNPGYWGEATLHVCDEVMNM